MIRYKDLSIPEPCTFLNTSKESKVDNAYFCSHCDKKVYDFRNKEEHYLNNIHRQTKGDFCGVFYEDQIRTYIPPIKTSDFFQRIKQYSILYLSSAFALVQNNTQVKAESKVYFPTEQIEQDSTKKFYVTTKEGTKYIDTFSIHIYINNQYYQYKRITDSTTIWLPDTIKQGDKISIKSYRRRKRRGYRFTIQLEKTTHVHKTTFVYKGDCWVEVSATKRMKLYIRKRTQLAGKFRF